MEIISITPHSPYCLDFENDDLLSFAWISDFSGCNFTGIVENGVLVCRMAWEMDPHWCQEKGVVGVATLETLHKYRCQGYAKKLVDYIRGSFPEMPLVLEVNSPISFRFWSRYNPVSLGRGRGHASLFKVAPLGHISNAV
ncbi:hypothetical protein DCCM_0815 [Desulfocucumis palustris]|uniref:N-acetyltransferase domain-containing protein n=1 Tax=Desulfocucumis palustris TaxID=1898651 RepID=A0A2L2X8S6_9FIRM|nr:hypothetical protein [Desulfocucumis palustris]GBF32619.1 hypothetical protein DCCM_0815 [Desulfocucumis palustris]